MPALVASLTEVVLRRRFDEEEEFEDGYAFGDDEDEELEGDEFDDEDGEFGDDDEDLEEEFDDDVELDEEIEER